MNELSFARTTHSVNSVDGPVIGYRQLGRGPGLILVHGGFKSGQDLLKLAGLLANTFTVYVPDRRGRGLSGPAGGNFSVNREVEDLKALLSATGVNQLFGLSAGALVVLKTALDTPAIKKIALYEPPLSINNSIAIGWLSDYEKQLAKGQLAAATVTVMKGLGTEPVFVKLPRAVLVPLMGLIMKLQGKGTNQNVTIHSLVPTMHFDMQIVQEMSDTLVDYGNLSAQVLLLRGTVSPAYFKTSLAGLSEVLPHATSKVLPGLGHDGPEDDGRPDLVATELRNFFSQV
jgi:pimeloyl-ACP methyl ester carboxylesterase